MLQYIPLYLLIMDHDINILVYWYYKQLIALLEFYYDITLSILVLCKNAMVVPFYLLNRNQKLFFHTVFLFINICHDTIILVVLPPFQLATLQQFFHDNFTYLDHVKILLMEFYHFMPSTLQLYFLHFHNHNHIICYMLVTFQYIYKNL